MENANAPSTPVRKRHSRLGTVIIGGALSLIVGAYVLFVCVSVGLLPTFQRNPGPFDRKRFEAVVSHVRDLGLQPGETRILRLDDLYNPQSLRPIRPEEHFTRGQGAGTVSAETTQEGKLKVVIETRDEGHAGEYGFAYSDLPLSPQPFGGDSGGPWLRLDLPGILNIALPEMKIDDHWWSVEYNLD